MSNSTSVITTLSKKDERRRFPRFEPSECSVQLRLPGLAGVFAGNVARGVVNVSEGGLGVLVSQPIEDGTMVRLRLTIGAYRETFELGAEVRRCGASLEDAEYYRVGLRFVNPSAVLVTCLRRMLFDRMKASVPKSARSA